MVAVGSVLPWLTISGPQIGTASKSGMGGGGDGLMTLVVGLLALLLGLRRLVGRKPARFSGVAVLAIAALSGLVAFVDISDVQSRFSDIGSDAISASVGPGLWVIAAGAFVLAVGGIGLLAERRSEPVGLPPPKAPPGWIPS